MKRPLFWRECSDREANSNLKISEVVEHITPKYIHSTWRLRYSWICIFAICEFLYYYYSCNYLRRHWWFSNPKLFVINRKCKPQTTVLAPPSKKVVAATPGKLILERPTVSGERGHRSPDPSHVRRTLYPDATVGPHAMPPLSPFMAVADATYLFLNSLLMT